MEDKKILIKKYENRRLYDSTNSRYVNLDEVAQAVRDEVEVQVVDAATGEDITRLILTQIIVENAKSSNSTFPLDVLRQMVIASGRASQEGALKYMKAIFDIYQNAYRAISPSLAPFDFLSNIASPHRSDAGESQAVPPPQANAASQRKAAAPPKSRDRADMNELRRRIDELESLVSSLGSEGTKSKPKIKRRRTR